MYDTGLADRLRADGLDVVEVDGWQTRGRGELYPKVFVFHHTADGPNGATPSLDGCIYGFANSAPGPLCNVFQSREPGFADKVYVVAAGSSNNAGSGGWAGHTGNSSTWGLEIEHTGTEHFPEERARIATRIAAAVIRGTSDESLCCQHFEWSTGGKIDVAQNVNPDHWRDLVREALAGGGGGGPGPTIRDEETMLIHNKDNGALAIICGNHKPQKISSVNDYHDGTWVSLPGGAWQQYFDNAIKLYEAAVR